MSDSDCDCRLPLAEHLLLGSADPVSNPAIFIKKIYLLVTVEKTKLKK